MKHRVEYAWHAVLRPWQRQGGNTVVVSRTFATMPRPPPAYLRSEAFLALGEPDTFVSARCRGDELPAHAAVLGAHSPLMRGLAMDGEIGRSGEVRVCEVREA